jgi:predicted HicB family RNase H-like nuclease
VTAEIDSACAIKSGVNRYTFRAQWSPAEEAYIGTCIELPSMSRGAPTAHQAVADIAEAVDQLVDDMRACGETAPTPLTERSYSGTFVVRTSPELHGRLALEAVEQRVSMNQWVVHKLAGRQVTSGFGPFGLD